MSFITLAWPRRSRTSWTHAAAQRQLAELRQRTHGQQGKQDEAAAEFRAEAANRKRVTRR
jgi:hypothetical protein